jgi:preprotein translocase subunit SecE
MAKSTEGTFLGELGTVELYKRNQGRLVRQLTFSGFGLALFAGVYTLSRTWLSGSVAVVRLGLPAAIFCLGAWVAFRLVNYPRFADFLISVESEIDKVSWPSRTELYRSTLVVLGTMLAMSLVLAVFDLVWQAALRLIGVLNY